MEKKFSQGDWVVDCDFITVMINGVDTVICDFDPENVYPTVYEHSIEEADANKKLIAAAPNMLDALLETDKDLCVLESTMAQIEANYPRAEGMTELVKKWRERNKLAINKATE